MFHDNPHAVTRIVVGTTAAHCFKMIMKYWGGSSMYFSMSRFIICTTAQEVRDAVTLRVHEDGSRIIVIDDCGVSPHLSEIRSVLSELNLSSYNLDLVVNGY